MTPDWSKENKFIGSPRHEDFLNLPLPTSSIHLQFAAPADVRGHNLIHKKPWTGHRKTPDDPGNTPDQVRGFAPSWKPDLPDYRLT